MKSREEPSTASTRGSTDSLSRPGRTVSASAEQPALSLFPEMMMEAVVAKANMDLAWKRVRANRGAPGPDGITLAELPKRLAPRWPTFRQQLLDGTYRPQPVRRDQRCASVPASTNRMAANDSSAFQTCWTV